MPRCLHSMEIKCLVDRKPFSVNMYVRNLYEIIQSQKTNYATFVALILPAGTFFVSLDYLSEIVTTYWFILNCLGRDPKLPIDTDCNDTLSRNSWRWCCALLTLVSCKTEAITHSSIYINCHIRSTTASVIDILHWSLSMVISFRRVVWTI